MHVKLKIFDWYVKNYNILSKSHTLCEQFSYLKKLLKRYGRFLWMGFHFLKAAEPLLVDSLLFTNLPILSTTSSKVM